MLDFIAGDRRADAPSNGWPDGWLQNTKDVEVVRAIMLAEELRNSNLRLRFWQVFRSQEADGRADYRRLFREAAIGGSARLSAYFAAKIWMNEWVKKQKIDVWHAFSVQQIAGIPAAYLWAFSHPVMGTTTGQRKLSRPLTPDTFANIWAIERKFNEALTSYYSESSVVGACTDLQPPRLRMRSLTRAMSTHAMSMIRRLRSDPAVAHPPMISN